jgi:hypothetical protein
MPISYAVRYWNPGSEHTHKCGVTTLIDSFSFLYCFIYFLLRVTYKYRYDLTYFTMLQSPKFHWNNWFEVRSSCTLCWYWTLRERFFSWTVQYIMCNQAKVDNLRCHIIEHTHKCGVTTLIDSFSFLYCFIYFLLRVTYKYRYDLTYFTMLLCLHGRKIGYRLCSFCLPIYARL